MASTLQSEIMSAVANVKNFVIADAIGHDVSHVSKITSGERGIRLGELEAFLSSIGMKVIKCEGEVVSIPKEKYDALRLLAKEALS